VRLRIRFTKHGKVRFTSHRDVARIWERAVRRSGLPVAYSEGFNPRPRLSFGLALSTGHESNAEYLDVEIDASRAATVDVGALPGVLTAVLPQGLEATAVIEIDKREPSLQHAVTSCTWRIDATGVDAEQVAGAVARVLAADEIIVTRERKGKHVVDDVRPLLLGLDVDGPTDDGIRLIAELGTQPRAVRPAELLDALDSTLLERRVLRLHQWTTNDNGERREPVSQEQPLAATQGVT
jgi:radical SAM-linked protein